MAQTAMVFGVLGSYGVMYLALVFLILATLYIFLGIIMNHYVKGTSPEIFLEVPPYRRPSLRALLKKTWMRIRWFLKEAIPFLFLGVLLINIMYHVGIMQAISSALSPFMNTLFGLPGEATTALVVGFLRKDLAVGTLIPLQLSAFQLVIAVTMLTVYFPCVATFSVLFRELGLKDLFKSTMIMIVTAGSVGAILRIILLGLP
jgi:ferrous iron transport protein B